MTNFPPKLIEKAKAAKSVEELVALAKENNVDLTEAQAKVYFEQLGAQGAVADNELEIVSGGGCGDSGESKATDTYVLNETVKVIDGSCPACGCTIGVIQYESTGCGMTPTAGAVANKCVKCLHCSEIIMSPVDQSKIAKI